MAKEKGSWKSFEEVAQALKGKLKDTPPDVSIPKKVEKTNDLELEKQEKEDESISEELVQLFMLPQGEESTVREIKQLVRKSRTSDIRFAVGRWLNTDSLYHNVKYQKSEGDAEKILDKIVRIEEIRGMLLERGYEAEAVKWLRAASDDGIKFGKFSKEERLREAEKYAELAGKSIKEIQEDLQSEKTQH